MGKHSLDQPHGQVAVRCIASLDIGLGKRQLRDTGWSRANLYWSNRARTAARKVLRSLDMLIKTTSMEGIG